LLCLWYWFPPSWLFGGTATAAEGTASGIDVDGTLILVLVMVSLRVALLELLGWVA
jgi:hypothetical protein